MDRRSALVLGAAALLAACGGGGGGGAAVASSESHAPADTPPSSAPQSSNIAMWGDSLTPPVAMNLQVLEPGRAVFNGGYLGQGSSFIISQQAADMTMTSWINVFWMGHNNVEHPEVTPPGALEPDVATAISHLAAGNRRFIVLSLINNAWHAMRGTDEYATVARLNADLQAKYPDNYLDVRSLLLAHYDPNNAQDVADLANDVPPSSLRYDDIHLRNEGSVLVAQRIKVFIDQKGW